MSNVTKIDVNSFVIKKDAIPIISNVYIAREKRIDGTTLCNFLAPALQDMANLSKDHFQRGFLVKTDELIPSYEAGLYMINPFFEIHSLLEASICTADTLPERLKDHYPVYLELQELSQNEQEIQDNRPISHIITNI